MSETILYVDDEDLNIEPSDRIINDSIDTEKVKSAKRDHLEQDPTKKQLVVYALVIKRGMVMVTKRKAGDKRLVGSYSVGIGGHVEEQDRESGEDFLFNALTREMNEELYIDGIQRVDREGLILSDDGVGQHHVGIAYSIICTKTRVKENKILEGGYERIADISPDEKFETWSNVMIRSLL